MLKIVLNIDEDQIAILLTAIEGMMPVGGGRGVEAIAHSVEEAAITWKPDGIDFEYSLVRIAPVYLQLLHHVGHYGDSETGSVMLAKNLTDFVLALRTARAAIECEQRSCERI